MEEQLTQRDEDGLRVRQPALVVLVDGHTDDGGAGSAQNGEEHPADPDGAAGDGLLGAADGHEPDDDMRLTEVAQPPGQCRDDADQRCGRPPGGPVVGIDLGDCLDEVGHSAQVHDSDDGHHDQCRHHHEPLNEVGVGHGQEPADERVDHRDGGDDDHAQAVVHPEGGLEEPSSGHHAGGDVEGEVNQDDQSAGPAQQPACVVEAVVQEARDGDRVVGDLGVGA